MTDDIRYSERYNDDVYAYRHVILPKKIVQKLPYPPRIPDPPLLTLQQLKKRNYWVTCNKQAT